MRDELRRAWVDEGYRKVGEVWTRAISGLRQFRFPDTASGRGTRGSTVFNANRPEDLDARGAASAISNFSKTPDWNKGVALLSFLRCQHAAIDQAVDLRVLERLTAVLHDLMGCRARIGNGAEVLATKSPLWSRTRLSWSARARGRQRRLRSIGSPRLQRRRDGPSAAASACHTFFDESSSPAGTFFLFF